MPRQSARAVALTVVALVAMGTSSCSGGKRFYPVRGHVTINGKPAEGVSIVFYLVDDTDKRPIQPSAIVQADGSFELKSFVLDDRTLKDGAPAGQYQVSCVWYPPDLQKYVNAMLPLPDRLNGKYSDPKTSGLKAEVREQPTELPPFELTGPTK
ncbi:MAG TPA: hypothetical protein VL371_00985 [Gemmataceae bacterium]|jgi:hypothetical protein|nr:hypothetical protein [Gemmataceae bacterium]